MEIIPFGPDDAAELTACAALLKDIRAADAPWERLFTPARLAGRFRYGWDGEPEDPFLATVEGVPVAYGTVSTSEYDNLDLAVLALAVHPSYRRRGHGSALLAHLLGEARRRGRTNIIADGWDTPALHAFASAHGFERKLASINRRQALADVDWPALAVRYDEARAAASDYVLERWAVPTPEDRLDDLATMASAINDAPLDDLDYEDEVFTADRMRAYEDASRGKGERMYRVVARHVPTRELAGQTVVAVDGEQPTWADQHDTSVTRAHRGHRLGLLLKAELLLWLREAEPQVATVSTWNAESNDHMIGVNELLAYRVQGREWAYQRRIAAQE